MQRLQSLRNVSISSVFLNTAEKTQKRCMYTFLSFRSPESENPTISICSGAGRRDA